MRDLLRKLAVWWKQAWRDTERGSIASSMWVEGYTDFEIEQAMKEFDESES